MIPTLTGGRIMNDHLRVNDTLTIHYLICCLEDLANVHSSKGSSDRGNDWPSPLYKFLSYLLHIKVLTWLYDHKQDILIWAA